MLKSYKSAFKSTSHILHKVRRETSREGCIFHSIALKNSLLKDGESVKHKSAEHHWCVKHRFVPHKP